MMETSLKPLSLSRLTKGSCNCYSRGLTAVAVNVTGYNGRRFSDTELRGRRSRGAPEGGSSWFNRAGGVSSFTGAVCSQLRFPVAFAPVCQLSRVDTQRDCCNNCLGKLCFVTEPCLHEGSCSAHCLSGSGETQTSDVTVFLP